MACLCDAHRAEINCNRIKGRFSRALQHRGNSADETVGPVLFENIFKQRQRPAAGDGPHQRERHDLCGNMQRVAHRRNCTGQQVKCAGGFEHCNSRHQRDERGQDAERYGYAFASPVHKQVKNVFMRKQACDYYNDNCRRYDIAAEGSHHGTSFRRDISFANAMPAHSVTKEAAQMQGSMSNG